MNKVVINRLRWNAFDKILAKATPAEPLIIPQISPITSLQKLEVLDALWISFTAKLAPFILFVAIELNVFISATVTLIPIISKIIPIPITSKRIKISKIILKSDINDEIPLKTADKINEIINTILKIPNTNCIIFDSNSILEDISNQRVFYSKDTCYNSIDKLNEVYNNKSEQTTICFLFNINSLLNKLSSIEKDKFTKLLAECKKNGNIKFIIIDTIEAIKSINYESWYKSNIDLSEGIWLGNGIGNQFTLRVTTNSRILRAEIDPGFGYIIKKGKAVLIKLISDE